MPFIFKPLGLFLLSIAALAAADKDVKFTVGRAQDYPTRQTISKVTIAAVPFENEEQIRPAFGKSDPNRFGLLPVLLVIQNDSGQTLEFANMKVEFVSPRGGTIENVPPNDVKYAKGPDRPNVVNSPLPTGGKIGRRKNPLSSWEIEGRAFSARMLPPGQAASGFFYFQTGMRPEAKILVNGIREANTGQELFYFEIPLR
jgi:hypothetical protein